MNTKQYFYRTAVYGTEAEKVYLIDINNPQAKLESLESWLGLVVSLADGQHTISELISHLNSQYPNEAPENLLDTLTSVFERLEGEGVVKCSDDAIDLPYYLMQPVQKLDVEKAKRLMQEDGYQK